MKTLIILSLVFSVLGFAQTDANEKTYTQAEFEQAVSEEVKLRIERVQVKNLSKFSRELLDKEQDLKKRELDLARREQQLQLNEKTLAQNFKDFKAKQDKVLGCISENDKNEKKRVDHVVQVISGMRPQQASEVLSVQDDEIAVKILGMLDPVKASKIFNLMDKEISARLQKQYLNMKQ